MPDDVRERVRLLIDLAVHPTANEGEARNAAVAAVKLIKEHNLLDESRAVRTGFGGVRVTVPNAEDMHGSMQDAIDALFGNVGRRQAPRSQRPQRPPPEHKVEGDNASRQGIPADMHVRESMLQSPAVCIHCQSTIIPPQRVIVSQRRVFHLHCWQGAVDR